MSGVKCQVSVQNLRPEIWNPRPEDWSRRRDSNPHPFVYETNALSKFELLRKVGQTFLPVRFAFSGTGKNACPTVRNVVSLAGFEPATFCLEDRRSDSAELQARRGGMRDEGGGMNKTRFGFTPSFIPHPSSLILHPSSLFLVVGVGIEPTSRVFRTHANPSQLSDLERDEG